MPDLIVLRLHPSKPMAGNDFTASLQNLSISAFDLSFGDSVTGTLLGTASGLANPHLPSTTNNNVNINNRSILQHYLDVVIDPITQARERRMEAVATAVIVINTPPNHPEYPTANSYDLRLEITRGGLAITDRRLDFNAAVVTVGSLSTNQKVYFGMPTSTYITLPPSSTGLNSALANVDLPPDGQPPSFAQLCAAINLVLADDPGAPGGDLVSRSPLTPAQARQVASEIVWNRIANPLPEPPASLGTDPFGALYTDPPVDTGFSADDVQKARAQFEAELAGYYGVLEAEALRLAGFVFSASAAVAEEAMSITAGRARLDFPLITGAAGPTTLAEGSVALTQAGGLNPAFVVPAAYFYAVAAMMPPQVSAAQRYDMARLTLVPQLLLSQFETAADGGSVTLPAAPFTNAGPQVNPAQAARRLHALGSALTTLTEVALAAPVTTIVTDWLAFAGPDDRVDPDFWVPEVAAQQAAYLELLLAAITESYPPLIAAIKGPPHNVAAAAGLVAITDQQWRDFFLGPPPPAGPPPRLALLPPFTAPGTPAERVAAFILHLRTFFQVPVAPGAGGGQGPGAIPTLSLSIADAFAAFLAAYQLRAGAAFQFGGPANQADIAAAAADVFPGDPDAAAWLIQALAGIEALFTLTDVGAGELGFSLIEALYARGFTSGAQVGALSPTDFQYALTGSVAYPFAPAIYAKAGELGPPAPPAPGPFAPVNPDGSLVDCVPPAHLSPLGPVEYLRQMLAVTAASTCDDPLRPGDPGRLTVLLEGRRGPLGDLHVTAANLETPVPVADLAIESLEAMAAGLPAIGGAVHDTAATTPGGHLLATGDDHGEPCGKESHEPFAHDPQTLFAALPEHSSPATPVAQPGAYNQLRLDFTAPGLPYPQGLDICRSYLEELRTNRFSAMRHFRKEITEFAIDPLHEPVGFLRQLWRYPVRLETALEYLRVSTEEYSLLYSHDIADAPAPGRLLLREAYGFPEDIIDDQPWPEIVVEVPEFLVRTGLTYCEFVELWECGFVPFQPAGEDQESSFPACQPCCPAGLVISFPEQADPLVALRELAVFIRLWRRLRDLPTGAVSLTELADICAVLGLFDAGGAINPEFIRQLAALVMLRDLLCLPMTGHHIPDDATGADRTQLLALWVGPAAASWDWAVGRLIDGVEDTAEERNRELAEPAELAKLTAANLDPLSRLAGFDPGLATDTWHAQPTSTLRFAEVLLKLYLSGFTVGDVMFLFTGEDHLDGDDPFPLQGGNESLDDPLGLPDDEDGLDLWALRKELLDITPDDESAARWTWRRIVSTLHERFGYTSPPAADDPLTAVGEHFFPSVLEAEGMPVQAHRRQFRADLPAAATNPLMWNTPPSGPLRYDQSAEQLWTRLPLLDTAVFGKLSEIRQLSAAEQAAVRDVVYGPAALLAPFALIFGNFERAVHRLQSARDDHVRWRILRHEFDQFYRRCRVIVGHLARHVAGSAGEDEPPAYRTAWRVLRTLWADENLALTPWEDDSGQPPAVTWPGQPGGGAFAALLGLAGTGLRGTFSAAETDPAWREQRGPMTAFGRGRNHWNAPVPTIIPSTGLTLTADQLRLVAVRNGFAMRDVDGEPLFGAQPFRVSWRGVMLIEHPGEYRFTAGEPTPDGAEPEFEQADDQRWRLVLRRGQKSWVILNHRWRGEDAPDARSASINLRRGAYDIVIEFEQREPRFDRPEDICPRRTGFQVKYAGPDTQGIPAAIPHERLFRDTGGDQLGDDLDVGEVAGRYLSQRYVSSLRDIRRTYQRAFKAVLLADGFGLSAKPLPGDRQSELGYLLDHAEAFAGRSYYRTGPGAFATHLAWFDLNLLPVTDPYQPPQPAADQRAQPSARRTAALFDWWERLYDYTRLRQETHAARERPAWRLFYEAAERKPDDPAELLRYLGIDIRHAPLVLTLFAVPDPYQIGVGDLESEPWPIRLWRCERWLDAVERCFDPRWIRDAEPARWAADDPGQEPDSGNENLTKFVRDGCLDNGEPRRYQDVQLLNDGLRLRARTALLAYLCGMNRVPLPFAPGRFATHPRDLSDLLLQDVEAGLCERASRFEDAVSSVQAFVQRARLGLEPSLAVTPAFAELWDKRFATLHTWQCCQEREVYRENWIEWDDLEPARRVEAFRFLEDELRKVKLTAPIPGGMQWWPSNRPPVHPSLIELQSGEPSTLRLLPDGPLPEGLNLLGTPERDARAAWLAPVGPGPDGGGDTGGGDTAPPSGPETSAVRAAAQGGGNPADTLDSLPLWIQAAVRLGARFVRVAAAGIPPGAALFTPCGQENGCCAECGAWHEPLIDEYYFWLIDTTAYEQVIQDADAGVTDGDETSDWHRPDKLPGLLQWDPAPAVHLYWSRVHNGEFQPARRSAEAVLIDPTALPAGGQPELDFKGRTGDSLRFEVSSGIAPTGFLDPTPPGFRYDLATDSAVVLPLVAPPPAPGSYPGGLTSYPFFAYVCPGAPVEPLSLFMVALTVAGTLRAQCRFEAALKWYELVSSPLTQDDTWAQCEDAVPTSEPEPEPDPEPEAAPAPVPAARRAGNVIRQGGGDLPCCPTQAPDDDVARNRAVLLRYLETLLQWGDTLLCRNSPEAFRQADVIFDTIALVLGDHPQTVRAQDDPGDPATVDTFAPRPAPLNPRLMTLYDRCTDRLSLVHYCQNALRLTNGRPGTDMPYFGNDPHRDGWLRQDCCCCDCEDCELPCCDPYRFTVLVQRALELAGDARLLAGALLAAYEKGDAEHLAALRASHERQLLELTLQVRQNQWRDADWQLQALAKSKEGAQTRLRYYNTRILNGLNAGELGYEALVGVSMASRVGGNVSEAIAQAMGIVPDFWFGVAGIAGTPLEFQQMPLGNKLAAGFATAARIMNALAEIASSGAALSLTQGGFERREDEWRNQVNVITIEIEQIERQILGAERRRDAALRDLNNYQQQIENAIQVQDFLRDKFTNQQLYLFLQQETAALYRQTYELARQAARRAQRAFNYERGYTARRFLPDDAWDSLHESLMAGERLQLAVRQMEQAYLDANCRESELTKHLSLRLHFPVAFLELRTTGYCEIEIPEWMFDVDYPGHYMRRIKSASLTIPCVVGPYTGVHCRLTLLSSVTRVDPRLAEPVVECCHPPCDQGCDPCCQCEEPSSGYAMTVDDSRAARCYAATEAIATSSGQNDSGMFELNFRDERYLPFEFAGAVSRWRIELPPETNFFDFDTLSDVVLHLNYTAREGGKALRAAAARDARRRLPGDGLRLIDVRHELPDAWQGLRRSCDEQHDEGGQSHERQHEHEPEHGHEHHHKPRHEHRHEHERQPWHDRWHADEHPRHHHRWMLDLRLSAMMFPFVPGRRTRWLDRLQVLFLAPCAQPGANFVLRFVPGPHEHRDGFCDCGDIDVRCVASSEWPGLFLGVVDLDDRRLGPIAAERPSEVGRLEFPAEVGEICDIDLVVGYCVQPWARCDADLCPCAPESPCQCRARRDERDRAREACHDSREEHDRERQPRRPLRPRSGPR